MKKSSLIDSPILADLLILKTENACYDLHNEFECAEISITESLIFKFLNETHEIQIIFEEYQIVEQSLPFHFSCRQTLDSFYRGRYQNGSPELWDEYEQKQCFYLDFLDQTWAVLARNVYFLVKAHSLCETFFWQVVELSQENYEQAVELLAQKSLSLLFEFEEILAQKLYALDQKSFAQAIYGSRNISKDDFLYVRCFTVSQGRTYYEKVLSSEIPMLNQTFEALLSLTEKAYFRKTATEFPAIRTSVSYETGSNQAHWS